MATYNYGLLMGTPWWHQAEWCSRHSWETVYHLGNPGKAQVVKSYQPQSSTKPSARSSVWVRATPSISVGWGIKRWRAVLRRGTWGCWGKKTCDCPHDLAMWACSPEIQPCPGLQQKQLGQQGEGGDSAILLCSDEILPAVLHPALRSWV